ncbi:MAG: S-layer homology domain-containing protein [Thermoanaerobaculia bacterium]
MRYGQLVPWNLYGGKRSRRGGRAVMLILALVGVSLTGVALGQVIAEFPVPTAGSGPAGITVGYDGNLWFAEQQGNNIARFASGAVITEFPIPTVGSSPIDIAAGADGNLWFTEQQGNKIGRITTAGVFTEFPVTTASSLPAGIAAGPDGSLWFTEQQGNKIGRITTTGVVSEFPVPTVGSKPAGITAGLDGNLWFAEQHGNNIGRITTVGVITEFPIPTASSKPLVVAAGPDGNLWFTESNGNNIGRITTAGVITEFPVPTANSFPFAITSGPDNLWFTEGNGNKIGRITTAGVVTEVPVPTAGSGPFGIVPRGLYVWFTENIADQIGRMTKGPLLPKPMAVDARAVAGSSSNANGVLEPGETVQVAPSWTNTLTTSQTFTGTASNLTGPAGPIYTINDSSADYGTAGPGATQDCNSATGNCYLMTVSGTRPVQHWDATFTESLSVSSIARTWKLHVGDSFPDVPTSNQFYGFIENLFHNGITGGCAGGNYCPTNSVTRAQMAVFLMKSNLGATEIPPPATGTVFADVPASNPFAPWIEQLAGFQITGGCGGGNYCPNKPVTRAQMAVFLLKSEHGSSYTPPACTGIFPDVPCPSPFADWIEQLFHENITGGCGGGNYCPSNPNTRGQMAVFLVRTFGLQLYGR